MTVLVTVPICGRPEPFRVARLCHRTGKNLSVAASGRITSPGYNYNAAGELIQRRGIADADQTLQYDQDSRLSRVILSGPHCPTPPICDGPLSTIAEVYRYGADRRRLLSELTESGPFVGPTPSPPTVTGCSYSIWAANQVMAEFVEDDNPLQFHWVRDHIYLGGRRLATIDRAPRNPNPIGKEVLRRHHPGLTTTRLITGSSDTQALGNNVLPFGTMITDNATTGAATANRRFGGYERSSATGLDYAVNRFYDPVTGRFVQPDPLGMAAMALSDPQSYNSVSYARNDPVNRSDPSGLVDDRTCKELNGGYDCGETKVTGDKVKGDPEPPRSEDIGPGTDVTLPNFNTSKSAAPTGKAVLPSSQKAARPAPACQLRWLGLLGMGIEGGAHYLGSADPLLPPVGMGLASPFVITSGAEKWSVGNQLADEGETVRGRSLQAWGGLQVAAGGSGLVAGVAEVGVVIGGGTGLAGTATVATYLSVGLSLASIPPAMLYLMMSGEPY